MCQALFSIYSMNKTGKKKNNTLLSPYLHFNEGREKIKDRSKIYR